MFKNSIGNKVQLKERDHEDRSEERERKNRTFVENFIKKDKWFGDPKKERSITNESKVVHKRFKLFRKLRIQMINNQFLLVQPTKLNINSLILCTIEIYIN